MNPREVRGCSLLAVFSHPDDESLACGGLLAWCAQLGARVSLVCATHGEQGPIGKPSLVAHGSLRDVRAKELEEAARVLGITDLVLLDYPDGFLPWVDSGPLQTEICDAIRRFHPDVVITFGADGLYWHPDHIAIHERTTAAVASLGENAPALYYVTMPPGGMRVLVDDLSKKRRGHLEPSSSAILGVGNADAFGADAAAPTLVVDVAAFAACKLAALKCHRSQMVEGALALMAEEDAARLLGVEHFHRAVIGSGGDAFIEQFAARQ